MKILVTGASGFIGSRIVRHLSALGHDVHCLCRSEVNKSAKRRLSTNGNFAVQYCVGCLNDEAFLKKSCEGVDVVVHCAGHAGTWGDRKAFVDANVALTRRLADAAASQNVKKWIQLSTPSIYFDFCEQLDIKETFIPKKLASYYAETKLAADRILFNDYKDRFSTIALRPRFVIGEGDNQIIPRLLRYLKRGYFPLIGGGSHLTDVTNVGNICLAIEKCLAAPDSAWNETYNITNGEPVVFRSLIDELKKRMKSRSVIIAIPSALALKLAGAAQKFEQRFGYYRAQWLHPVEVGVMANSMTLNIDKAKEKLGYVPDANFRNALDEYFQPRA